MLAFIYSFTKYLSGYTVPGTIPVSSDTSMTERDNENLAFLEMTMEGGSQ